MKDALKDISWPTTNHGVKWRAGGGGMGDGWEEGSQKTVFPEHRKVSRAHVNDATFSLFT